MCHQQSSVSLYVDVPFDLIASAHAVPSSADGGIGSYKAFRPWTQGDRHSLVIL